MSAEELILELPIGVIKIKVQDNQLKQVHLNWMKSFDDISTCGRSNACHKIARQISAYFSDKKFKFKIDYYMQGTDFQRRVWLALTKIPVGQTITYGQLATILDSGPRAVANACRKNPTPIVVPCHRVVSATGVGGFAGQSKGHLIDIKQALLKHEGVVL
ncbi:MAG: methylated-DNA--[protein]-cysteine S-methyltransferase [Enterobacterales bacterium]|nr:methylated-DNA--[protein]-cysteine S-methyltransferase [Enterobacterales bacterium]